MAEIGRRRKAIRIEVEYDDGYLERAVGDDAEVILQSINSAHVMNYIHGMPYTGPQMKEVKKEQS